MGALGGIANGVKDVGEEAGNLTTKQKVLKAGLGGLAGGLQQVNQQQPQGGGAVTPMIPQPQYVDFSQMGPGLRQRSNFFGG